MIVVAQHFKSLYKQCANVCFLIPNNTCSLLCQKVMGPAFVTFQEPLWPCLRFLEQGIGCLKWVSDESWLGGTHCNKTIQDLKGAVKLCQLDGSPIRLLPNCLNRNAFSQPVHMSNFAKICSHWGAFKSPPLLVEFTPLPRPPLLRISTNCTALHLR